MIRAAVLKRPGEAPVLEEVELAPLTSGEVLVRIAGVGICHTDLAALAGALPVPLPAVFGHEGSGVVEAVADDVTTLVPGDHVVLSFDRCGDCRCCADGHPAYCEHFNALNSSGHRGDGTVTLSHHGAPVHGSFLGQSSFATHAIASVRNAVVVPKDLPLELLGPLGCSLQTGAGAVMAVLEPPAGSSLGVFGCGAVGLAAVMAARATGCGEIVAVEPDPGRRALALTLGATAALDPRAERLPHGLDCSIETVGTTDVVSAALGVLASPGRCVTLGFRGPRNPITIDQGQLLFGRSLIGVIEGDVDPHRFIGELLALHAAGSFPLERLMATYPLDEIGAALDDVRAGSVVKAVLVP